MVINNQGARAKNQGRPWFPPGDYSLYNISEIGMIPLFGRGVEFFLIVTQCSKEHL